MVVGWAISERMTADIAVEALERARARLRRYVAIFHSDRGSAVPHQAPGPLGRGAQGPGCPSDAPAAASTTPSPSRSSRRSRTTCTEEVADAGGGAQRRDPTFISTGTAGIAPLVDRCKTRRGDGRSSISRTKPLTAAKRQARRARRMAALEKAANSVEIFDTSSSWSALRRAGRATALSLYRDGVVPEARASRKRALHGGRRHVFQRAGRGGRRCA